MVIIETSVFTRQIIELIPDEYYQEMQEFLVRLPTTSDLTRAQIRMLGQLVIKELEKR